MKASLPLVPGFTMLLHSLLVLLFLTLVSAQSPSKGLSARNSSTDCHSLEKKAIECVRVGIGFLDHNFDPPRDLKGVDHFCT